MDALRIGAAGMVSAVQALDVSAQRVASGSGDETASIVALAAAKTQLQASAAVVKTADAMTGAVLNLLA